MTLSQFFQNKLPSFTQKSWWNAIQTSKKERENAIAKEFGAVFLIGLVESLQMANHTMAVHLTTMTGQQSLKMAKGLNGDILV